MSLLTFYLTDLRHTYLPYLPALRRCCDNATEVTASLPFLSLASKSYCKASSVSWECLSSRPRGVCPGFLLPPVAIWTSIVKKSTRTGPGYEKGFNNEYFETAGADQYKIMLPSGKFFPPVELKTQRQNANVMDLIIYKARKMSEKSYNLFKDKYDELFNTIDWNQVKEIQDGAFDVNAYLTMTGRSEDEFVTNKEELDAVTKQRGGGPERGDAAMGEGGSGEGGGGADAVPPEDGWLGFSEDTSGAAHGAAPAADEPTASAPSSATARATSTSKRKGAFRGQSPSCGARSSPLKRS
eukprot:s1631_g6.t1